MIGIISAMHDEVAELLAILENTITKTIGERTYYQGTINQQEVVIVFSNWGKVAAAITTTQLISTYQPREIIFTGVAGAIDANLNIGDVVFATQLVQHDMDASPLFPKFEIPLIGKSYFETSANNFLYKCVTLFKDKYYQHISKEESKDFYIDTPKIVKGLVASGDQFISDVTAFNNLKENLPELQCVEMEGAAVAQVCEAYKIPFNIIRIISDKADHSAPVDFPKFTKQIASKYAKGILESYCS